MHESESEVEQPTTPTASSSDRRRSKVPPSRRYKPPELSRSVEVLDKDVAVVSSKKNLDHRSQSELDVWQGAQRQNNELVASAAHGAVISSISQPTQRRGSLGQVS